MNKTIKLKFLGKNYYLELLKSKYLNGKLYLGLYDTKSDDYFSDITVNLPGYQNYKDYNFIDPEFLELCFSYVGDLEKRLKENLNIKEFHQLGGYYYFTL